MRRGQPTNARLDPPLEICSLVCTFALLSQFDFHAVSWCFCAETERMLHTSVDPLDDHSCHVGLTSLTHRPHLAYSIITQSLTMPAQTNLQADDLSRLAHALHLYINLRNLSMLNGKPPFSCDADAFSSPVLPYRLWYFSSLSS